MGKNGFMSLFKTKAERKAYAMGRKHQFDKEHPIIRYESVPEYTVYDEDGSIRTKYTGRAYGFRSKRGADLNTKKANNHIGTVNQNSRVMRAVKSKKVNVYSSDDCTTEKWITRKVDKPYRV